MATDSSSPQALRTRRLAELRRLLQRAAGRSARQLLALVPHFFKDAPDAFVLGYAAADLRALVTCAYRILVCSAGKSVAVSAFNPVERSHGFSSDRTVIQISAPDGPFYVSSVRERLRSLDAAVIHLIHPIVPASWDARGRLCEIGSPLLDRRQSLIHIEIERVEDPARLKRIEREIQSVFADLRLAIDDFEKMRGKLTAARGEIADQGITGTDPLTRFLLWMDEGNFVFLGYREYGLSSPRGKKMYAQIRGSGLGILRRESRSRFARPVPLGDLSAAHRRGLMGQSLFVITQTSALSPLYRRERMICLAIKRRDGRGRVVGERRWFGLFTNRVEGLPSTDIPILSEKFAEVVKAEGAEEHTHNYQEIYSLFSSYPKDFLFGADVSDIRREIRAAMAAQGARDFKATFRPWRSKDEIAVMVVMSRDKFSREVRLRLEDLLRKRLAATAIDCSLALGVEGGEFARLYFSCLTPRKNPVSGSFADLEREMAESAKTWPDRLNEELVSRWGPAGGRKFNAMYGSAFSIEFHSHTPPGGAAHDIARLETLYAMPRGMADSSDPIEIDLFNSRSDADCSRIKLYHLKAKLILSDIMPILTAHGLRVVDEVSNSVRPRAAAADRPLAFIHTFRVKHADGPLDLDRIGRRLSESILGSVTKKIECDPLCSLILLAGISPREVALLRMYRNFLHQIVPVHTLRSIEDALVRNPMAARNLVDRFQSRFDPSTGRADSAARRRRVASAKESFEAEIEKVDDILEDRILRLLTNAIDSTVRTTYYQTSARGAIGIKIRSADLHSVPKPVPLFEIFVSDADFEGIHLRGGRIARGGIRHSDRRDDYRTEILGLMKTQMVKNAIIVPSGAKGGFVVKASASRDRMRETVVAAYRRFIRTLLDLTDNQSGQRIVHPAGCVIYDEPDPYLVVAADKGTADFSDMANEISTSAGFWLGDAFASGGENGYDHKKLGITARGAFECIRHHLEMTGNEKRVTSNEKRAIREVPVTRHPLPITCAGIGDMSGDVFGNGLLCADGLAVGRRRVVPLLKAAFNHQYIFLDPDPDAKKSAAERRRLFGMGRSSWADYDRRAISAGGGIYPRAAKKISLSPRAVAMLGLASTEASGEDVVRRILKLDVDLLYNGGIGVYVKSSTERAADVGDAANDRVRVSAPELRCRIVGEGGNNGFTQAARIEFARAGGRINTDAVDNSAGVDLSDHEVNLKILMGVIGIPESARRLLLRRLTGEICRRVLQDNILQSRVLTCEEWRSVREIKRYPRMLDALAAQAGLSREVEGLPPDKELAERAKQGAGLYRPELAVVLAYVKLAVERGILEEEGRERSVKPLAVDPVFGRFLESYFPAAVVRRYRPRLGKHPLANQIVATTAANAFVNQSGLLRVFSLTEDSGASIRSVLKAYFIAETIVGSAAVRAGIIREASRPMPPVLAAGMGLLEETLGEIALWMLREFGEGGMDAARLRFKDASTNLSQAHLLYSASDRSRFDEKMDAARRLGFSPGLSRRVAESAMALKMMELEVVRDRLRRLR